MYRTCSTWNGVDGERNRAAWNSGTRTRHRVATLQGGFGYQRKGSIRSPGVLIVEDASLDMLIPTTDLEPHHHPPSARAHTA
jgi:hypothetical protein